jgi:hypothetical protein
MSNDNNKPPQAGPGWRPRFKTPSQLRHKDASENQLIRGFMPCGVNFISGLPGDGKSWVALSIAKSLYQGAKFLDYFEVPHAVPIIYLSPEVNESSFLQRLQKLGLDKVKDGFYCQTLTDGPAIPLNDSNLVAAVKDLKPAIVLDTVARFNLAQDENAAMETAHGLAKNVFSLLQDGAKAVIPIHHATKRSKEDGPTLGNSLRGSTDLAAMADSVYNITCTDPKNFVATVRCVKSRDFDAPDEFEFRGRPHIDEEGKLVMLRPPEMDTEEFQQYQINEVGKLIASQPKATHREIAKACKIRKAHVAHFARKARWQQDGKTHLWIRMPPES